MESALFIWLVMRNTLFSLLNNQKDTILWSCRNVSDALHYLSENVFIRFGFKLDRHIVDMYIGTNWAPIVALFLFCYEKYFMLSLRLMISRRSTLFQDI